MLGHIGINVPDLAAAKAYYDALIPLVAFESFLAADDQFAYRPAGGKPGTYLFFYPATESGEYSPERPGLQHLAFVVKTRAAVNAVHDWAEQRGDTVLHAPQEFPQYPPPYYSTFWLDPFGMKLEAVCHYDRD
jgi:catechol 2,3-dioxygenase-like lactoylglutathione lyase family enzyme